MPHKVFVHSAARVNPGISTHSDFSYQLAVPIDIPQSRCFVDQVHIPNEFPSIHENNKFIYVEEDIGGLIYKRKLALPQGYYNSDSLATALTTLLNTATNMAASSYACTFDGGTGRLTITTTDPGNTFYIWTAEALKAAGGSWALNSITPTGDFVENDNAYDVLGFHDSTAMQGYAISPVIGSSHVNIVPFHTLYIHSSLGSQNDSVGPSGSSSVLRTVCLDQPVGRYVHDRSVLPFDYVSVAKGQIRQLDFRLTDWRGRAVPLTNSWSFSLIFLNEEDV